MKKLIWIVSLLFLNACAYVPGPSHNLDRDTYNIKVKIYDSYEEVSKEKGSDVYGFATWNDKSCTVHYVHNDWETFIHEVKHCYYKHWHN